LHTIRKKGSVIPKEKLVKYVTVSFFVFLSVSKASAIGFNLSARVVSCFVYINFLLERYSAFLTTPALTKIVHQGRCDALTISVVVVVVVVTDIYFPLLLWANNAILEELIRYRKNVSHKKPK